MIAMQYRFPLPADYDMAVIDARIAGKGHFTDGFPGLLFKAYLSARKTAPQRENAYAPFYVWRDADGMNGFLAGPGFVALTQSFGWPSVAVWSVWHAELHADVLAARWARIERVPVAAHMDLRALRDAEIIRARQSSEAGALAVVAGYEPTTWTLVRFALFGTEPEAAAGEVYAVGHVSLG